MNLATKRLELLAKTAVALRSYHYIYGFKESDNPVTEHKINALARQYKSIFDTNYIKKAKKFIGQRAIDCSGLVCSFWEIPDIGSSQLAELPTRHPDQYQLIDAKRDKLKWGDCLWKGGHVGIYIEDGKVVESKGINYGVRISTLESTPWVYAIRKKELHMYDNIGWCREKDGRWWYTYGESKGEYFSNCRVYIGGKFYTFDADGYMTREE